MYDEWISPEDEKKEKRLAGWIIKLFLFVFLVGVLTLLLSCGTFEKFRCDPEEPKATLRHFLATPELVLKGFDEDCSGDLDYWQHYMDGEKYGRRIYIKK